MKLKSWLLNKVIFVIMFVPFLSKAQTFNFIPNPSFEKLLDCSKLGGNGFDNASPWDTLKNGGGANPDLFNGCSTVVLLSVPRNGLGFQYAKTGNGYVLLYVHDTLKSFAFRDYAQVKLLDTLQSGKEYCVTFFINLADRSNFAIDEVGAYFDDGSIHAPYRYWVTKNPQVKSPTGVFMSDTANWMKVQGSFIANGKESYLTLGNFRSDSATLTKYFYTTTWGSGGATEYIFDDISVVESNSSIDAGNDTTIIIGDTITLGKSIEGMPVEWLDVNGNLLVSSSTIKVHPTSATKYIAKMDLCGFISYDTITVSTVLGVDKVREGENNLVVYPNPATNQLTVVSGWLTLNTIEVMDVLGRVMVSLSNQINSTSKIEHQKEIQIDVSDLSNGIYFIKATNEKGNVSVGKFVKE